MVEVERPFALDMYMVVLYMTYKIQSKFKNHTY